MMRRLARAALAAVVPVLVAGLTLGLAAPARADLCADARRATQPDAPSDDPLSGLAAGVWLHVYNVYFAATGRSTELHLLGPHATTPDGHAFPPYAFICPATSDASAPGVPKLFVTWPLVELADKDKLYDVDFLALVMGHELGHRTADFDWEGRLTTTSGSTAIEAKADLRGAFFAAAAGYSTRRVACDAALDLFLNVEAGVSESARAERKTKLAEALEAFDVYESLYDAASAWTFWESDDAQKLLSWVDDHLTQKAIPIPEFKLLLAQTLIANGVDTAPWTGRVRAAQLVPSAPCIPLLAEHTAFWDQILDSNMSVSKVLPPDGSRRSAAENLQRAVKLLNAAEQEGASALVTASSLACAYAYLDDTKTAARELERAATLVPKSAPSAIAKALAADRAFVAWLAWFEQNPVPDSGAPPAERAKWGARVQAAAATFAPNGTLAAWTKRMRGFPAPPAPAGNESDAVGAPKCAKVGASDGMARLPPIPPIPRAGGCPCGWSELHFLADDAVAGNGVRTCVPAGWAIGMRYIEVALEVKNEAALSSESFARRLMSIDRPAGAVASLATWQANCKRLVFRSVSNRGTRIYAGICPALGAQSVVIAADECRVLRATVFPSHP